MEFNNITFKNNFNKQYSIEIDHQKISSDHLLIDFQIFGGGNTKSVICSPCDNTGNQEIKDNPMTQHVDQTTTQQQREYFIQNVENYVNNLKSSSGNLKNQNSKVAFTQSINWMNSNQLVVFDIMLGLKGSDIDVIETFETCILRMLDSIENVLKKSKNIYLGFIICSQTAVLVTGVYRYYLSHPMDEKKSSRIVDLKEKVNQKIDDINYILDKLKENDMSINYFEQILKIIQSFTLALPDQQSFKPLMNFASGLGKMILTGGTSGLSEMFSGIKEGLSQAANKKIHEEQVDNFIMFVNLEKIKFSIIKILFDKKIDNKDEQIKLTLQSIGKSIEKSTSWSNKYYFVQVLSELILYQPQIDSASLSQMLTNLKFPYDIESDSVWELLVKNNWVTQFKLEDGAQEKVGFLNFSRSTLEEIDIDSIRLRDDSIKQDKNKNKKKPKNKDNPTEIIQNFVVSLNQILKNFEPVSNGLRDYMLKGDQQFKGLMSYCFEGLEDQSSPQGVFKDAMADLFAGKDPLDIIQISIEKILNFAIDFFNQQFSNITKNSEAQLRIVFVASIKDYSDDITNYIFTSNFKFESFIDVNPTLKNFTNLYTQLDESLKKFVEKIQDYSSELIESLNKIQTITNNLQDNQTIINSVQSFIVNQSKKDFFDSIATDITNKLAQLESIFEQIQMDMNLQSFETKEQTTQILNKSNSFVQKYDDILIQFQKIKIYYELLGNKAESVNLPDTFIKLKLLLKKIQGADEKDPKLNKYKFLIADLIKSDQFKLDIQNFINQINQLVKNMSKSVFLSLTKITQSIQNQESNVIQDINSITDKIFYYVKMVNEFLKNASSQFEKLSQDLEALENSSSLTHAQKWTQLVNENLKQYIQQNKDNLTRESLKTFILQQGDQIENLEIQDEQESGFMNCCNLISNIFNDLSKLTTDIFQIIIDSKKQLLNENPSQQDKMIGNLMMIMGNPLNELKSFMTGEMSQIKERLVDDIQGVFKDFENNEFAKSIGGAMSSLKSATSFVDLGGLASSLFEKFADQNWRIRDRIVLILFDLNRIFGGENGDQLYANTLIHMKAKDTSLKVQQTLKNEELLLEMKSILSTNWKSQEAEIKAYIQNHFKELDQQVEKMKTQNANKDQMLKMYERSEAKLNQQLENISDIGQMAGIQLEFLKDLKKQLFKLSQDVEAIKKTLENLDDNMTILKGKSVYQLFQDRKSYVFTREKENELNVKLKVCEYDNGEKKGTKTYQIIDEDDQSDDENNPLYTTVICEIEEFKDYFQDEEENNEEEKEDEKKEEQQIQTQENQEIQNNQNELEQLNNQENDEFLSPNKQQLDKNEEKNEEKDSIIQTSVQSLDTVQNLNSPDESFVCDYINQNNTDTNNTQNQQQDQIQQNQQIDQDQIIQKKKKKKNIIDKFLDEKNKKNSLLLHGQIGSGSSRSAEQIEYYIWKQRRITREKVLDMIRQVKSINLRNALEKYSINEIFEIMERKKLIDKKGYFLGKFIELEGKLEDIKILDQIKDQKQQSEGESEEESVSGEEKQESSSCEEEEETYELKDLLNEKSKAIFKSDFIDYMELEEEELCYAIYEILDEQFQDLPIPIYIQIDKINDPKKLINETLSVASQYNFTDINIRQLTQLAKSGDLNLIFIISGYEKLKQEFFGLNLFSCNEFEEYRPPDDHKYLYPKVITTCNTNVLSGSYASNFQNIFKGRQRGKYFPEEFYVEYFIENLNQKQIFNFLKQKFVQNLKGLLYDTWCAQYQSDAFCEDVSNKEISDEFEEVFYSQIKQSIYDQKIYKQISIPQDYQKFLIDSLYKLMGTKDQQGAYLYPLTNEQLKHFKMKLQNIVTKKLYLIFINEVKILSLLKTVKLLSTFVDVIDQVIIDMGSFKRLKQKIIYILTQEEIIQGNKKICINDIINLLTKPINFLDNHFHYSHKIESTKLTVSKMLNKNAYLKANQDLTNNLTLLIVKALYDFSKTRYNFYNIFFRHFVKKQISEFKRDGLLIGNETSMYKDCILFAVRLATAFQREGIEQFNYENQSQLYQVRSQWDEFFLDSEKQVRKQVRECLPLICTGTQYSFLHSSVKDYILSKEYYKYVNGLQISTQFLEHILQFRELQKKHEHNNAEVSKKKVIANKNQINTDQPNQTQISQDSFSQQQLIDIVLKQTQETIKKEIMDTRESLKNEIHETMKINIQELQKKLTQGDNQASKQQESNKIQLYFEELFNNSQVFQDFINFYKKIDKNMLQSHLHEKLQEIVKQLKGIAEIQLNQQPDLYSSKNSGVCEFLFDKLKLEFIEREKNKFMQNLLTIIQIAKFEKSLQVSACNAIGLLIYSNRSFNNVDFSGLDLSKANFYGGQFYRCTFRNCNMQKVNLSYSIMYKCHFINTNLSFAILRNCCLLNCKFTNKTNLKKINFMRPLDVDYQNMTNYKDKNTGIIHKDPLVHVMVNPLDKNYLLAIHTYQAFIINIKDKSTKAIIIKIFQHPFTLCGMIEFNYNDHACLIAGQGNKVVLLQIKTMQIIKTINLNKINQITSIVLNKQDSGILIGGINQETQQKFIELGYLESLDSKILTDECNLMVIDKQKQMIICHADDKNLYTTTVLCLSTQDYKQIGQKQYLHKKLGYVKDNQLQKNLKLNKNHAIDHPSYDNLHIQMLDTEKQITDFNIFQYDGTYSNQDSELKPNRVIIDHVRILQKNTNKYGRHQKIILNPDLPKQLVVVSELGLIQRLHFINERQQNYELVQETHEELNHIEFFINVHNQDKQFITCYIKDHFNGIIKLRKLQFDAKKQSESINKFSITEEYNLKTRLDSNFDGKQLVIKHQVLKMQNHESLHGQFILVMKENQDLIKIFFLCEILNESRPDDFINLHVKDLAVEGELFSSFEIHPKNADIFCFLYNQEKQNQCPQCVVFDVQKNVQLAVIKFEMSPYLWKIQIDNNSNLNRMFLYNKLGQVKVYNDVGYSYKMDQDINVKGHSRNNSEFQKSKSIILQSENQLIENIEPENESIFYDSIDKNQCIDILGFHPNSNQFLYFFDYLNHKFIQYDTKTQEKTILTVNSKQKFINNSVSSEEKQRKTKKKPSCMKIDYFENVKLYVDEYFKNNNSSLEQAVKDEKYEEILAQYKDQIQLVFHPILQFIFIVFKEQKVIIVYNIDKKSIIQLIKIPLYFDKQVPFNMTIYNRNKNMLICTYYQTIDIYIYRNNNKQNIEEFTNIYTKVYGKSQFLFDNSQFENCQLTIDTLSVLKQNGASILKEKNIIVE